MQIGTSHETMTESESEVISYGPEYRQYVDDTYGPGWLDHDATGEPMAALIGAGIDGSGSEVEFKAAVAAIKSREAAKLAGLWPGTDEDLDPKRLRAITQLVRVSGETDEDIRACDLTKLVGMGPDNFNGGIQACISRKKPGGGKTAAAIDAMINDFAVTFLLLIPKLGVEVFKNAATSFFSWITGSDSTVKQIVARIKTRLPRPTTVGPRPPIPNNMVRGGIRFVRRIESPGCKCAIFVVDDPTTGLRFAFTTFPGTTDLAGLSADIVAVVPSPFRSSDADNPYLLPTGGGLYGGPLVHFRAIEADYLAALRGLAAQVQPGKMRVVVAGHSLGAAQATMAYLTLITSNEFGPVTGYTLGSPKCARSYMAAHIALRTRATGSVLYRLWVQNDLATAIPWENSHVGRPYQAWRDRPGIDTSVKHGFFELGTLLGSKAAIADFLKQGYRHMNYGGTFFFNLAFMGLRAAKWKKGVEIPK